MTLTARELRICDLYRQGETFARIAELEGIGWRTVRLTVISEQYRRGLEERKRRTRDAEKRRRQERQARIAEKRRRLRPPRPPRPLSPRQAIVRQRRSELYRQGFVQREIGAVEGVTHQAVSAMNLKILIGRADRGTLPVGFLERSGLGGCGFCELCGQTAVAGQRRCAEHPANGVEPITVMLEPRPPRPPTIENVWHERRTMRLTDRRQREEAAAAARERRQAAAEAEARSLYGTSFWALKSEGEIKKWTDKRCSTGPGTTM